MTRILAVADEVDESLYGDKLDKLRPDLMVSCGDLPFDYLEYLVSRANVPLLYVPGNHDPSVRPLLDMEGLNAWLPGRTSGYAQLVRAIDRFGTIDAFLDRVAPR